MLQQRQVIPHTVIMFDKQVNDDEIAALRQFTTKPGDSEESDDLANDGTSQTAGQLHQHIESVTVPYIQKNFNKSYFKFVDQKQAALDCIGLSLRATLIVSGKDAYDFIHQLYDGLAPNKNIVNIIVYCQKDDQQRLCNAFEKYGEGVDFKYVIQD